MFLVTAWTGRMTAHIVWDWAADCSRLVVLQRQSSCLQNCSRSDWQWVFECRQNAVVWHGCRRRADNRRPGNRDNRLAHISYAGQGPVDESCYFEHDALPHRDICLVNLSANASNSSCVHWLASVSGAQRHPTWLTCISVSAVSSRTHLRSAMHCDLVIPRTHLAHYGPCSFTISGPATWNSLPPDLHDMSLSAASFSNQLRTKLFIRAYYNFMCDHSTFVIVYYKRGRKLTLTHCILLYCIVSHTLSTLYWVPINTFIINSTRLISVNCLTVCAGSAVSSFHLWYISKCFYVTRMVKVSNISPADAWWGHIHW